MAADRVPFVGCKADGQLGPVAAPKSAAKSVQLQTVSSQPLAYYKAKYAPGVLAPRGWNCFGLYGSSGAALFVAPQPLDMQILQSDGWKGFDGPVVMVNQSTGDTSGRFDVARIIARVFPTQKAFVQNVISEDIEPAANFPFGPFPADRLTYRGDRVVEYETPAHSSGLGTFDRMQASDAPVDGVAILQGKAPDSLLLTVRLPAAAQGSASAIVQQFERDNPAGR